MRTGEGKLRPVHGHAAFAVLRRALDALVATAASAAASPNLVVTTPVGQLHEFGGLLVAASAAMRARS